LGRGIRDGCPINYEARGMDKMKAPIGGKSRDYELIPEGVHPARFVRMIDLGTQESEYGLKHQIWLAWELPFERRKFTVDGEEQDAPAMARKFYTFSGHEKAALRIAYESVLGRLDEAALAATGFFDPSPLLDQPCQVQIGRTSTGNDKVMSVLALARGQSVPARELPLVLLELSEEGYDAQVFNDDVTPGIQEIVRKSPEWQLVSGEMAKKFPVGDNDHAPGFDAPIAQPAAEETPF
jgi:hypothetical protein